MRSRPAVLLLLLALVAGLFALTAPAAPATVLAQQPNENTGGGGEGQDPGGGGGQDNPGAESGANEGQTEEGTSAETTGPPWTYQMARITLALVVLLALGLGYLYFRLIVSRRKGGV